MNKSFGKVLIVNDDKDSNELINNYLKLSDYKIKIVLDGNDAKSMFLKYAPNVILVDLLTKNLNGMDFLKWIRKQSNIPMIVVTSNNCLFDKVLAFDIGADDYILKPFKVEELLARMKAIIRRCSIESDKSDTISISDLSVNLSTYEVFLKGNIINLPPKEFELLVFLLKNTNKVFTRKELLDEIWGNHNKSDCRTVDVHIKRLREKFEPNENYKIVTLWRKGYKFQTK
ncbi:response regulator transcription factor [Clostridium botulinum]|uniref:response regulator transcription factor n=1 Tax=Clostridium botulinum TaxID=1491 RepID=UPI00077486E7|nr:response regulator transcription factor [Clostridium botulinum]NFL86839.1 response regulator transcription factor [Clostridium botulinum]NFO21865.1 response regulator transcription factor [Clostridium botulinum]